MRSTRKYKLWALGCLTLSLLTGLAACRGSQRKSAPVTEGPAPAAAQASPKTAQASAEEAKVVTDRRKGFFDHLRKEHRVKPNGPLDGCTSCHQRDKAQASDAKLNQPGRRTGTWLPFHDACTQCHAAEAFQQTDPGTLNKSPMCASCHRGGITNNNQALLASYPGRLNEFGLLGIAGAAKGFSHRTHTDAQKMSAEADKAKCSTCHRFDGQGVQASFPHHQECFSCHVHQAEQKLGDCSVCHINTALAVSFIRGPEAPFKAFRFRHSPAHLKAASCDRCHHTQEPLSTSRVDILKISTGQGLRHTSACWTCHQQAKEPLCTKCHTAPPPAIRANVF
ncbi:MAG: hypothetical protein HYR56_27345 [Acidobacteria bacterium]|nr:hypothetical protein [Acidobacteriota bacterium]MBI3423361.1 hypothetical protein [Acidobacteriota bacterium]